jgi:putative transposase
MPRPHRVDFPEAWHHVVNRGAARVDIFRGDDDRNVFTALLAETAQRYSLETHSYCLMDNHYHLLLRSREGRLADGMRYLAGRFTQVLNHRRRRDGAIFRGRYASVVVASDAHLVQASRYIHLNPVTAGLVQRAEDWPWSSAAAYVGRVQEPVWLTTSFILGLFEPRSPRADYRKLLEAGVDRGTTEFYMTWGQTPSGRSTGTVRIVKGSDP